MREYTIDKTASGFANTMKRMGDDIRTDLEKVMNGVSEKTFAAILANSPVDKGNYMASNRMAAGAERTDTFGGDFGGARKGVGRIEAARTYAKQASADFNWKLGDGSVWFSNNIDHADAVEDGGPRWTKTAPYKVYGNVERKMENVFIPEEVSRAGL